MATLTDRDGPYDGNALAGPLSEVFALEVTEAVATCHGCGQASPVATLVVYGPDPGLVGRCPGCSDVLMRLVRTPDAVWLDLSGTSVVRFAAGNAAPPPPHP